MNLDDTQKRTVAKWIEDGVKLSEIQNRLFAEFSLRLTYMEVRLLVDDLKLIPKDPEPPKPAKASPLDRQPAPPASSANSNAIPIDNPEALPEEEPFTGPPSKVKVTVDQVTRPGSMISGSVVFSDGNSAQWYLDQYGRLGLATQTKGYKPSEADVQAFQMELQNQIQKLGY